MIAKELQEEGIPTKRGAKWTHSRSNADIKEREIWSAYLSNENMLLLII